MMRKKEKMDRILSEKIVDYDLCLEIRRVRRDGTAWTESVRIAPDEVLLLADEKREPIRLRAQKYGVFRTRRILDFDLCLGRYVRDIYEFTGGFSTEEHRKEYRAFCETLLETGINRRFCFRPGLWKRPYESCVAFKRENHSFDSRCRLFYCYDPQVINEDEVDYWSAELGKCGWFELWKQYRGECDEFLADFFRLCLPRSVCECEEYRRDFINMLRAHDEDGIRRQYGPGSVTVGGELEGFFTRDEVIHPRHSPKENVFTVAAGNILLFFKTALQDELARWEV